MAEKGFEVKLTKLAHDIEQLDARVDSEISSIRAELRKEIRGVSLAQIRDISLITVTMQRRNYSSQACDKACEQISKLAKDYEGDEKDLGSFQRDINRITEAAGIGKIWRVEQ